MQVRVPQSRSIAPLIVGALLALTGVAPLRTSADARIERLRVDPARDPACVLESLEGMGAEGARRIVAARKGALTIGAPGDLIAIPGIGTRLLHRWHDDLAFAREAP